MVDNSSMILDYPPSAILSVLSKEQLMHNLISSVTFTGSLFCIGSQLSF